MTALMLIVGSVRPGRAGLPVAQWARSLVQADGRFELDFVDLVELGLPFLDEPSHPSKREYTKPHTIAWSARVDAADAFLFVTPEYNHSYSPALKNAIDFVYEEWHRKPVGFVSYGGSSGGTRGVAALDPVISTVGLVKTGSSVDINFIARHIEDGVFVPEARHPSGLGHVLDELHELAGVLKSLR